MRLSLEYYIYSGVLNFVSCATITFLVLAQKRGSRLVRLFSIFTGEMAIWALFYFAWLASDDRKLAEFFLRTCMVPVVMMPASFFHFMLELVKRKVSRSIHFINYGLGFLIMSTIYGPLFATSADKPFLVFPYWLRPGPIFPLHVAHFVGIVIISHSIMFNVIKTTNLPGLKKQVSIVFWGTLIGFSSGITNYLAWYRLAAPIANPIVSFYTTAIAYAVVKHQLMDIEVLVKRTLQFAGLVGFAVLLMAIVPKYLLQFFGIPRAVADILGAVIVAASFGKVRESLVNVTDRYLFQKKYDYKELLKKFTDEVMLKVDLKQLLETTVNTLTETVKLDGSSLLLFDKDKRTYEWVATRGANGQQVSLGEQEQLVTFLRETHEPVWLDGKVDYPQTIKGQMTLQLKSRLALPLHVHEDLIGVLLLGKKKSDEAFGKDDLDILTPLARTLAIAVTNAQLFEELAKTQAEAAQKEKLAVIGTLSAGINHEICNPLGIVKAQCEAFLLDSEDGILIGKSSQDLLERTSNIMRVALKQIDRATAITQKLSNFAKPIKDPTAQTVSIEQEIDEVLILVGHDLKLEKIEVVKEIEPGLPQIVADRRQLQEVLFNLVRNAGQAIKPPGTIWVRARTSSGLVRVEITDTGSGISEENLKKIYNPFFTTKEPGKGTGLGLFIVRQIVERNKGRIGVESIVGKGTTFSLEFPAVKASPQVAAAR